MGKPKRSYTPLPQVPPQAMQRLTAVLQVLAGTRSVAEAARSLGMSRNHFQTLLHRGIGGLVQGISPKPGGRPAKPAELTELEAELNRLRRENTRLRERTDTTDRLLQAASGLLQGRIRATGRQARPKRTGAPNEDKGEPEPEARRRRALEEAEEMTRLGLTAGVAAAIAGVHAATLRRWRERARRGEPLARRACARSLPPSAQAAGQASTLVRSLHGLVGAEALRRSVSGISRRQAAWVKAQTLTLMERERKSALRRVTVTAPDVMRGLDGMYLRGAHGALHALITADAAVPYRTLVRTAWGYDAHLVARALRSDIERHGAPLVYRLDRASAHDTPAVRDVLEAHQILVLHGPPHCPRFYGQQERQNREHRAWAGEFTELSLEEIERRLQEMLEAVNKLWRRRTLGWRTAHEAWSERSCLRVDRRALREEVSERAARIGRQLVCRGKPADLAERLAIEQALESRGYLRQTIGGWC